MRQGVLDETNDMQTPWESSSLVGEFYFAGGQDNVVPELAVGVTPLQGDISFNDLGKKEKKPWYKKWYVWAAIVATGAVLANCTGGTGATADSAGSGGGCF